MKTYNIGHFIHRVSLLLSAFVLGMSIAGIAKKATRALRKLKHSIAKRNRSTWQRNTFILFVIVKWGFHGKFKVLLE